MSDKFIDEILKAKYSEVKWRNNKLSVTMLFNDRVQLGDICAIVVDSLGEFDLLITRLVGCVETITYSGSNNSLNMAVTLTNVRSVTENSKNGMSTKPLYKILDSDKVTRDKLKYGEVTLTAEEKAAKKAADLAARDDVQHARDYYSNQDDVNKVLEADQNIRDYSSSAIDITTGSAVTLGVSSGIANYNSNPTSNYRADTSHLNEYGTIPQRTPSLTTSAVISGGQIIT